MNQNLKNLSSEKAKQMPCSYEQQVAPQKMPERPRLSPLLPWM
jgi:hypothetical protein